MNHIQNNIMTDKKVRALARAIVKDIYYYIDDYFGQGIEEDIIDSINKFNNKK